MAKTDCFEVYKVGSILNLSMSSGRYKEAFRRADSITTSIVKYEIVKTDSGYGLKSIKTGNMYSSQYTSVENLIDSIKFMYELNINGITNLLSIDFSEKY